MRISNIFIIFVFLFSCTEKTEKNQDIVLTKSINLFKTLRDYNGENIYRTNKLPNPNGKKNEYIYSYKSSLNKDNEMIFFDILLRNKTEFKLTDFVKSSSDSINFHFLKKINDTDTLYYFKVGRMHGEINFIMGKYNYFYESFMFNRREFDLFSMHRDSLKKVRGNIKLFKGME